MDNIQGYSSENESDNDAKTTSTTKLKSFKVFNNDKYTKNKIVLHQPLHIEFRENTTEKYEEESSDVDNEIRQNDAQDTEKSSDKTEQNMTEPKMTEFNTSEFYEENAINQDKYEGQLKSNQPLKQLSNVRLHQLSNIIRLGQANEAKLHELHGGSKVHKPKILKNKK